MTDNEPQPPRRTPLVSLPESLLGRLGLAVTGSFLLSSAVGLSIPSQIVDDDEGIVAALGLYLLAFVLFVLAASVKLARQHSLIILASILVALFVTSYAWFSYAPRFYPSDVIAFTHTSAEMVVDGENPYSVKDRQAVRDSAWEGGLAWLSITKQADGDIVDRLFIYPAGHLLPFVAMVLLGFEDMRWLLAIAMLGVVVVLWWQAPEPLRPFAAVPLIVAPDLAYLHTLAGAADVLWLLPMMLSAVALYKGRNDASALAFGWAAATKQQPWIVVPFLLIWLWKQKGEIGARERLKGILRYGALASAVFLAINLPFMVWNFSDWLSALVFPFNNDLIFDGYGLVSLTTNDILELDKTLLTALSLAALLVLLAAYWFFFDQLKYTLWIAPAIVFWFAQRSLQSYFVFWAPLVVLAIFALWREQQTRSEPQPATEPGPAAPLEPSA